MCVYVCVHVLFEVCMTKAPKVSHGPTVWGLELQDITEQSERAIHRGTARSSNVDSELSCVS